MSLIETFPFISTVKDWLALIPPTAVAAGIGYTVYLAYCPAAKGGCSKAGRCNQSVRKHEAKVVDMIDIENIAEKAAFCRCWKSKNVSEFSKQKKNTIYNF